MRTKSGTVLVGNWRQRMGTKTDAHLFHEWGGKPSDQPIGPDRRYPMCGKRIPLGGTWAVHSGRPCTDCLVAAISKRLSAAT